MRAPTLSAPITDRQLSLILQLSAEHPGVKTYVDTQLATYPGVTHPRQLTKSAASNIIGVVLDDLRAGVYSNKQAFADRSKEHAPEVGMYRSGGDTYRVYYGQQSGRNLVAILTRVHDDPKRDYRFEYVGLAASRLPKDATPLPLEEAKEWGRMTGTCCVCAKRLDVPKSVDAGIGPKCARSFS